MSTRVSLALTTTGSRTSGYLLGLQKLLHWSSREKVMGTSDHLRQVGVGGSTAMISLRWSFFSRLDSVTEVPPKMTATTFSAFWKLSSNLLPLPLSLSLSFLELSFLSEGEPQAFCIVVHSSRVWFWCP